jgi:hypothetical protein
MEHHTGFLNWTFRSRKTGRISLAQLPNWQLVVWLLTLAPPQHVTQRCDGIHPLGRKDLCRMGIGNRSDRSFIGRHHRPNTISSV